MLSDYSFNRLEHDSTPKPFNCGEGELNEDLNEFFNKDAVEYLKELLAVTYYYENENETVAYFSVINDIIINKDKQRNRVISKLLAKAIPHKKRRRNYPAAKIARLSVHADYQSQFIGREILTFVKSWFAYSNKTGCRFITVDAYNETRVIKFYVDNGFKFLVDQDQDEKTRLMYFDLITLHP